MGLKIISNKHLVFYGTYHVGAEIKFML